MKKEVTKVVNTLQTQLVRELRAVFESYIPELKEIYLDTYVRELTDVVVDRHSLSNPENFYEDYEAALDNFDYFYDDDEEEEEFRVKIPTEDTFDFEGRMNFIHLIVNGNAGKYYELPQEDYDILRKSKDLDEKVKRVIYDLPEFFDDSTPRELRFYLVPSRGKIYQTIQGILGKKLILFPFSNSPPINIFEVGEAVFEDNFDKLVTKVIGKSIKEVKRRV